MLPPISAAVFRHLLRFPTIQIPVAERHSGIVWFSRSITHQSKNFKGAVGPRASGQWCHWWTRVGCSKTGACAAAAL